MTIYRRQIQSQDEKRGLCLQRNRPDPLMTSSNPGVSPSTEIQESHERKNKTNFNTC